MKLDAHDTLWTLTRGQRARYGASMLALWLAILALYGVPAVAQGAIDGFLAPGAAPEASWFGRAALRVGVREGHSALWTAAALVVGLTGLAGLFQFLRGCWAAIASEAIVRRLRRRLYAHLESLPCAYHDAADTGDLVQRCTSDVETLRVFLSGQIVELGRSALLLVTVLPLMLWLDVGMTAVALALYPLILGYAVVFFRRIQAVFLALDEAEGRMTTALQENLTGIRVVRAFARADHECRKFGERNREHRDRNLKLIRLLAAFWSGSDFLCFTQIGLVLMVGAHRTAAGELSLGALFAFLSYESLLVWPLRQMGRVLVDTGKASVALGRLREILAVPEESVEPASDAEPRGHVQVEGLTFAFAGGEPVLRDLSFEVRPGETLALLGPPGSGKSTLVHLLLRLYDYDRGSIRLDGRELASVDRREVRASIGAVLQEPFLYSKTLGDNLRVGRHDASHDELVRSATAAAIHDVIESFQDGYDTLVGERGVTLSGGQRQRVALGRALLRRPAVLILDDALSAVDTHTESAILAALRDRRDRRTTILIAHRLSSVAHADRILVLEDGRVVQSGTHAELLAEQGPYRRLWHVQGALDDEIERTGRAGARRATAESPQ